MDYIVCWTDEFTLTTPTGPNKPHPPSLRRRSAGRSDRTDTTTSLARGVLARMSCFGDREKGPPEHTQKWEFITLSDFRCNSVLTSLAYVWLWFMALVAVAVYTLDTFTAVNLLAFSKWSSQVQPTLAFKYSKWIFAGCILFSWTLCIYEWIRAVRVIKRNGVAESYMDPLAVRLQSMRGQGWKRFLVFTELTKSKKGADYVAFFVYFSFQGAIRVILAEGPRQIVNALTLYAVLTADLLKTGKNVQFVQFFVNIKHIADQNLEEALIYFSMLFTLVIWVFSALSLILAAIFYICFLWHYVPQEDGRLSVYCRRKIDKRLAKIVEHKVKAAFEEEERQNKKIQQKAELIRQKTGELPPMPGKLVRQPTLPDLGDPSQTKQDEKLPGSPLVRHNTSSSVSTLPPYSNASLPSYPNSRAPSLPDVDTRPRPGMPSRSGTQTSGLSNQSYAPDAPLLENVGYAGEAGYGPRMPPSSFDRQNSNGSFSRPRPGQTFSNRSLPPTSRMGTPISERSMTPMSRDGPLYPGGPSGPQRPPPPQRLNSSFNITRDTRSPLNPMSAQDDYMRPFTPPVRHNTADSFASVGSVRSGQPSFSRAPGPPGPPGPPISRPGTANSYQSQQSSMRKPTPVSFNRSFSPATLQSRPTHPPNSYELVSQPSHSVAPPQTPVNAGYIPFNPTLYSKVNHDEADKQRHQSPSPESMPEIKETGSVHVREPSQHVAPSTIDHDRTSTYADIFDDYGTISPYEEHHIR